MYSSIERKEAGRPRQNGPRGFTLIESMMATVILAISVMGLAQLMGVALHQTALGRNNTMALTVATHLLEELKVNFNKELEDQVANPFAPDHPNLTAGAHGPRTVALTPPAGSTMGTVNWTVNWTVTIEAQKKTVQIQVSPQTANPAQNETVWMTAVLVP